MTRTITLTKEQIDALQFSLHEIIEVYETIDYSEDQVMDQRGRDDTVSRLYEVLNKIPGDYDVEALKVTNYSEYGVVDLEDGQRYLTYESEDTDDYVLENIQTKEIWVVDNVIQNKKGQPITIIIRRY